LNLKSEYSTLHRKHDTPNATNADPVNLHPKNYTRFTRTSIAPCLAKMARTHAAAH